jgi:hypothetical protein
MNGVRYWRAGFATLFVALLAYGCGDDPMSPDSTTTPTAVQTADEAADAADPLFVVTDPGGGDNLGYPQTPAYPSLPAPTTGDVEGYCVDTRFLDGDCLFINSTGEGYWKQYNVAEASGSGVFDPFVRISANTPLVQGVNTSGRNLVWDENSSPTFTRDLRLDEVPQVECPSTSPWPGETCRELGLDTNQEGGSPPGVYISIDAVRIYVSPNENICDVSVCKNGGNNPFDFNPFSESFGLLGGELIWALDGLDEETNGVGLDFRNDSGSGRADVLLYLNESEFDDYPGCDYDQGRGDDCGEYVHVYSHFGANNENNDGYEEWNVRILPIVLVSKTADVVADKRITWDVDKNPDADYYLHVGDQQVHEYTIDVTKTGYELLNFRAQGVITITNPDKRDPALITKVTDVFGTTDITDQLVCPFTIGAGGVVDPPYELAKNSSIECTYGPINIGDDFTTATNTATVRLESGGQFEGSADADVADVTIDDTIDESVTLSDDKDASVGGQYTDTGSETYQATFVCDDDVTNTATITGDDSGDTLDQASATVTVTCYDLTVAKTPDLSFDRQYFWDIDKSADQTEIELSSGQSFIVNYAVQVDTTGSTDSNWADSGMITITNNHPTKAADLTGVVDTVFNGTKIPATVSNCSAMTVPAAGSVTCDYDVSLPDATTRTNTAFATMQNRTYYFDSTPAVDLTTTTYSGSASINFSGATGNLFDECITVSDTFNEFGGDKLVCILDGLPYTINYQKTFVAADYNDCEATDVPNLSSFVTGDTGGTGDDPWTITIIRDCPACTLTQGYWKTHNETFTGGASKKADPFWYDIGPLAEGESFFLSGQTYYQVMWTAPGGNAYYLLGRQWIAATLNYAAGADGGSEVDAALAFGQALFENFTPEQIATWDNSTGGVVPGFGYATRHDVIQAAAKLDWFNNYYHCDDDGYLTVNDDVPIS